MIETNYGDGRMSSSDSRSDINEQFRNGDQGSTQQKDERKLHKRTRSNTAFIHASQITPGQIMLPVKKEKSNDYRSRENSMAKMSGAGVSKFDS